MRNKGFTLVELMIVLMIIAILAMIAAPRFASLIRRANEGATKGNLGVIRSALGIYYADMEGTYPLDPTSLTVGAKYLAAIPVAKTPGLHETSAIFYISSEPGDGGGWRYDNIPGDANYGHLWVNCDHTDMRGTLWTAY